MNYKYSDPLKIHPKNEKRVLDSIKQFFVEASMDHYKLETLSDIFQFVSQPKTICYFGSSNPKYIKNIKNKIEKEGIKVSSIYKGTKQTELEKVMNDFHSGAINFLISDDYQTTNIDFRDVKLIFNFGLPLQIEKYINRITGSGKSKFSGIVINVCNTSEVFTIHNFERIYDIIIEELPADIDKYFSDSQNSN